MYLLSAEKFEHDCSYIVACEDGLVGQAIVARNDEDGQFHLGRQLRDFTYSCLCFLNCPARSEMMVKKGFRKLMLHCHIGSNKFPFLEI